MIARPAIDYAKSEFVDGEAARIVTRPHVRAFLIGSTDARAGWPDALIDGAGEQASADAPRLRGRRRRLWL